MALLGQRDGTLLAGCHQTGIMRIAADGTTTPASQGLAARSMSALALSPDFEHDGVLYTAGIEDGVLRSADRGATWESVGALPTNQVLSLAVVPAHAAGARAARGDRRRPLPLDRLRGTLGTRGVPRGRGG